MKKCLRLLDPEIINTNINKLLMSIADDYRVIDTWSATEMIGNKGLGIDRDAPFTTFAFGGSRGANISIKITHAENINTFKDAYRDLLGWTNTFTVSLPGYTSIGYERSSSGNTNAINIGAGAGGLWGYIPVYTNEGPLTKQFNLLDNKPPDYLMPLIERLH